MERRTPQGLSQGVQQQGRRGTERTGGNWGRGDVAVVLAQRRAVSAAAAALLSSGPSSSFTTSNVALFSAA